MHSEAQETTSELDNETDICSPQKVLLDQNIQVDITSGSDYLTQFGHTALAPTKEVSDTAMPIVFVPTRPSGQ